MTKSQIEYWALRVVDRVRASGPREDAYEELKAEWPQVLGVQHGTDKSAAYKVARQLAGLANARGEPVLWLIGVDEDNGIVGADPEELASWWPRVEAQFDDSELLSVLVPRQRVPEIEVLGGALTETRVGEVAADRTCLLDLSLKLYVVPREQSRLVIPFHRCRASAVFQGQRPLTIPLQDIRVSPDSKASPTAPLRPGFQPVHGSHETRVENLSRTIQGTETEILIDGPGLLNLTAHACDEAPPILEPAPDDASGQIQLVVPPPTGLRVDVALALAMFDFPLIVSAVFHSTELSHMGTYKKGSEEERIITTWAC